MEWLDVVKKIMNTKEMSVLKNTIKERREIATIYPAAEDVFNAFKYCPYEKTKLIIIGDEPDCHGLTNGLAYSTIYTESRRDLQVLLDLIHKELYPWASNEIFKTKICKNNNLIPWAKEGILLLNYSLTVEKDRPESHFDFGWDKFIKHIIKECTNLPKVAFLLIGKGNVFLEYINKTIESPYVVNIPNLNSIDLKQESDYFIRIINYLMKYRTGECETKSYMMSEFLDLDLIKKQLLAKMEDLLIPSMLSVQEVLDIEINAIKAQLLYEVTYKSILTFKC